MFFQYKDDEGFTSAVADGYLMNAPYIEEVNVRGKLRTRAKFCLKFGFKTTLEDKKSSRAIWCTVWNDKMIDLCRTLGKNDSVIVLGLKVIDKANSDKYGVPFYNIQVSTLIPVRLLTETLLHQRETKRYEKNIMSVYKKSNRENKTTVSYDGEPDRPYDAEF